MKIDKLLSAFLFVFLLIPEAYTQSKATDKINNAASGISKTNNSIKNASNEMANSAKTLNDVKSTFKLFLGDNKMDQTVILIAGIDYDDENLSLLMADIKKIKAVKSVSTNYKSGSAKLEVSFKGNPTE